jgi:hypothetical protein
MAKQFRVNELILSGKSITFDPANTTGFLRKDGNFGVPAGGQTYTPGSGLSFAGSVINSYVGQSTGFQQNSIVTMTAANTYVNAVSGNIGSGTWFVHAGVLLASTANAAFRAVAKLYSPSAVYGSSEGSMPAMGASTTGYISLALSDIVIATGVSNPIALGVISTLANTTIRPAPSNFPTGIPLGTATDIECVRLL